MRATSIEIKRHVQHLSEKETDDLVCAMADLFVAYVKRHGGGKQCSSGKQKENRSNGKEVGEK